MSSFLGTGAPLAADINLLAQICMGVALFVGAWLARHSRYTAHGICQASVMLLNLVSIAFVMGPAFHAQVAPVFPRHLGAAYYGVAAAHAALGIVAEILGIYVSLVAGTKLLPERLCFHNWKRWMRFALALWWLVLLLGVGTYLVWYASA